MPLLPPPMAEWIGGWLLRIMWAVGGVGVVSAAIALEGPGGSAAALAAGGAATPSHAVLADPVASLPEPAAADAPRPGRPTPPSGGPRRQPVTAVTVGDQRAGAPATAPAERTGAARRSSPSVPAPAARSPIPATEPPAPGNYAYTLTRDGRSAPADLTVTDAGERGDSTAQQQTWTTADGTQGSRVEWSAGAELLAWTAADDGSGCSYTPGVLWLHLPLAAGSRWQGQSSCSYEANGAPVRLVQSTAARVVTAATTSFSGRRVVCWVIERDIVTTATTNGTSATSETRTTDLFAPAWGLAVYETGKSEAPESDGSVATDTWTLELQE